MNARINDPADREALQAGLSGYYRSLTPADSLAASKRAARTIATARAAEAVSPRTRFLPALGGRAWGFVAAGVVAIALAVSQLPAAVSPARTPAPPTPNVTAPAGEFDAAVFRAGVIRSGGYFAIKDNLLLTSTDWGATWQGTYLPDVAWPLGLGSMAPMVMLDPQHAWLVDSPAATDSATPRPNGTGSVAVERTVDGGKTWQRTDLAGDLSGDASIAFSDAQHGFVVALNAALGSSTVFRTADGGATWQKVTSFARTSGGPLGLALASPDASTLWAGASANGHGIGQATLAVSRDGGVSWSDAQLPGAAPTLGDGGESDTPIPPTFFDAQHGLFAIQGPKRDGPGFQPETIRMYETSDAGRSWANVGTHDAWAFPNACVAAPSMTDWILVDAGENFARGGSGDHWTVLMPGGYLAEHPFWHVEFADSSHGFGWNILAGRYPLYLTSDGGKTWSLASFGAATAGPLEPQPQEATTATIFAEWFEQDRAKGPAASAWASLSAWSQRQFGTQQAFEDWQQALNARGWWDYSVTVTPGTNPWKQPLADMDADLRANADVSRAYIVLVQHPALQGTPDAGEAFVVAPLKSGGWRVWLAKEPPKGS